MKLCGACCNDLPKESFSKKQWQLKQYRRCTVCIHADRDILPIQKQKEPEKKMTLRERNDPLAGLEGFERLQAVGNALGVTIIKGAEPSPPDAWDHLPPNERDLMKKWEETFPPTMLVPGHPTKSGSMKALAIRPALVKGIRIGNWYALTTQRIMKADAPVNYVNNPPLSRGDCVEILPGNAIKWELVGQKGIIMDYFDDDDKWGIEIKGGMPSLVMAGNLKRISYENFTQG